jgi:hypothetical protein
VEYPFFAQILALCRARIITNPIKQLYSLSGCVYSCLIGLVTIWSRLSAMYRIKTIVITAHLCSETAVFLPKITPIFALRLHRSIRYSRAKHAVHSYLRNWTTAHTEYLMGSTVNNLVKIWVCKLSFLKRHPSDQKSKIMKQRALLQWKEKKLLPLNQPRLLDWSNTGRRMIQIHV